MYIREDQRNVETKRDLVVDWNDRLSEVIVQN
jgi:hypothetical protein